MTLEQFMCVDGRDGRREDEEKKDRYGKKRVTSMLFMCVCMCTLLPGYVKGRYARSRDA
jgi:hypothetical protein